MDRSGLGVQKGVCMYLTFPQQRAFFLLTPALDEFIPFVMESVGIFQMPMMCLWFAVPPVFSPQIFFAAPLLALDMHSIVTKHSSDSSYRSGFLRLGTRRSYSERMTEFRKKLLSFFRSWV